jgi:hypothetical protein
VSFLPFKFTFTPPKTVQSPSTDTATAAASVPASQIDGSGSQAGKIVSQIKDLLDASSYLQQAILSRHANTGVKFDPSEDPELARALTRKFGSDNQVNTITIPMYSNLLDAEATAHQLEISLGPNSSMEPNPLEVSDTAYITRQVEQMLVNSGEYKNQIPVLLRGLKSDSLLLANWSDSFQQYPVLRSPQASQDPLAQAAVLNPSQDLIPAKGLDVSPLLSGYMTGMLGRMNSIYASIYTLLLSPNHVENDLLAVTSVFSQQAASDIARLVSVLTALKSMSHKESLSVLAGGMSTFVYARLGAGLGQMATSLDRLVSMAVDPLKSVTGQFGRLLGLSSSISLSVGRVPAGGMAGSSLANPCLKDLPHNQFIQTKSGGVSHVTTALDAIPDSLAALSEHLTWGLHQISFRTQYTNQAFMQLAERRLNDRGEQLNLLCSMSSIDTLINLGKGFISQKQTGSSSKTSPAAPAEAIGGILSNLSTSTGTGFTLSDGQVLPDPVDLPAPSDSVSRVLKAGGLNRKTSSDMRKIVGENNAT